MRRALLLLAGPLLAGLLPFPVRAQADPDMFRAGSVTVDGTSYPYRLLAPPAEGGASARFPLVVFLHGAGERGTDNERQLTWFGRGMAAPARRAQFPCFVLAVQCPRDAAWVERPWDTKVSHTMSEVAARPLRAVIAAMEHVLANEAVDEDRVYLTGLSMGGFGAWELACRMPERFAALVPVCGGGDTAQAHRLLPIPTWAWHGGKDRTVWPERSREMVAAIRVLGGVCDYTELPDVAHDSWKQAYGERGALEWMFAQDRKLQGRGRAGVTPLVPLPPGPPSPGAVPRLQGPVRVAAVPATAALAQQVVAELTQLGFTASLVDQGEHDLLLACPKIAGEGWRMDLGIFGGRRPADTARAAAAWLQMFAASGGRSWLTSASDPFEPPPTFVSIDCARQAVPVGVLREIVRLCWLYRVPGLCLHLTDDEAFTFPSKAFPELVTEGRGYACEDLAALIAHARALGVQVVPEIDVPGHAAAIVRARPEWGVAGDPKVLNFARDDVRAAVCTLIGEAIELFGADFVHLGGDEVATTALAADPLVQELCRREELAGADQAVAWFLGRMCEEVQRRGRRPMLWDGFDVEHASHLPKGVTVCVWDGRRGAPAGLRKHGLEIVNASFAPLYIVGGKQAFAGTVEEIHAWDSTRWRSPFPDHPYHKGYQLPVGVTERRPGAMLCVWELPADEILPALRARLPVFAERATNPEAGRSLRDYLTRFAQVERLARGR